MINVSGLKVVPCEVEEAIAALPGVLEVKVYAGQHRSGSQMVKAAVAVESGLSVADIRAHCERQLVYYKRPQVVNLVDALPRNPAGQDHPRSIALKRVRFATPVFHQDREGDACRLPWLLPDITSTTPGMASFPCR